MLRLLRWIWSTGILGTFLTGLFVLLPLVITIGIMGWVGSWLVEVLGPQSRIGQELQSLGLKIVTNEWIATLIGWGLVLGGIWLIGLIVKSTARYQLAEGFHWLLNRIPFLKSIYGPVSQVVDLLKKKDKSEVEGMQVVYCSFGQERGGGFLALLATADTYRFAGQECCLVYIPTSPLPMSGGIIFVPVRSVQPVDMSVEELMQVYFSLGVMASRVVPFQYQEQQRKASEETPGGDEGESNGSEPVPSP